MLPYIVQACDSCGHFADAKDMARFRSPNDAALYAKQLNAACGEPCRVVLHKRGTTHVVSIFRQRHPAAPTGQDPQIVALPPASHPGWDRLSAAIDNA